ncbi:hypothetical protein GCM10010244_46830 [Streptomyces coeruleorubidus]|nr:hypothetical protein GCM10010244_46830 [Streptomyces bellus]
MGYEADAAVVEYVAEKELGCKVVTKDLKAEIGWQGFETGEVDAILENWGHEDLKKKYVDQQKTAVSLGSTGNEGVIGWYVPPWIAKKHPDITDWASVRPRQDRQHEVRQVGQPGLRAGEEFHVDQRRPEHRRQVHRARHDDSGGGGEEVDRGEPREGQGLARPAVRGTP